MNLIKPYKYTCKDCSFCLYFLKANGTHREFEKEATYGEFEVKVFALGEANVLLHMTVNFDECVIIRKQYCFNYF